MGNVEDAKREAERAHDKLSEAQKEADTKAKDLREAEAEAAEKRAIRFRGCIEGVPPPSLFPCHPEARALCGPKDLWICRQR